MAGEHERLGQSTRFDSAAAVFAVDLQQHFVSCTPAADAILRRAGDGLPCYEVMRALDPRNGDRCRPDCAEVAAARRGETPTGSVLWNPSCLRPRSIATLVQGQKGQPPVIIHVVQPSELPAPDVSAPPAEGLTERQVEALRLLADGLATRSIAHALGVSPVTVRNHIQTAMERLGAHTRLEAVMLASQAGLL